MIIQERRYKEKLV